MMRHGRVSFAADLTGVLEGELWRFGVDIRHVCASDHQGGDVDEVANPIETAVPDSDAPPTSSPTGGGPQSLEDGNAPETPRPTLRSTSTCFLNSPVRRLYSHLSCYWS